MGGGVAGPAAAGGGTPYLIVRMSHQMRYGLLSVQRDVDVVVVAAGEVLRVGAAVEGRAVGGPVWLFAGPDESLPDQVVQAVVGLVGDQPASDGPALGDVGGVVGMEEDVAGAAAGVVAVRILPVGVPAAGAFPNGVVGGEGAVEGGGAGGDV